MDKVKGPIRLIFESTLGDPCGGSVVWRHYSPRLPDAPVALSCRLGATVVEPGLCEPFMSPDFCLGPHSGIACRDWKRDRHSRDERGDGDFIHCRALLSHHANNLNISQQIFFVKYVLVFAKLVKGRLVLCRVGPFCLLSLFISECFASFAVGHCTLLRPLGLVQR